MLHNEPAAESGSGRGGVGRCRGGEVSRGQQRVTVVCSFPAWYSIASSLPGCCHVCLELGAEVRAA